MQFDSTLIVILAWVVILTALVGPLSLAMYFAIVGYWGPATFYIVLQALIWWLFS